MMRYSQRMRSRITSQWKQRRAVEEFATGVSLHSHTSVSEETLGFIHEMFVKMPGLRPVLDYYAGRSARRGLTLDFERANWRPPLQPKMAYDLEAGQILRLGLSPLVSLTDHDTIEAAMLLRTVPSSRHIPVSVEWSAPFGQTVFHLGIHNLPSRGGAEWMKRMAGFTAQAQPALRIGKGHAPCSAASDALLLRMLRELHEHAQVLIVLNHPLWDLHKTGAVHVAEMKRFLGEARSCVHAIELNGLRHVGENREVAQLAKDTGHLVIAGGDRHGLEPNANINLTSAISFTEFVEEIRVDRVSHVHFMEQYRGRWEQRILRSTLDAVTDFPEFMPGWRRWDERAFHPDKDGVMRPLAALWPEGRAPLVMQGLVRMVRLGRVRGLSAPLSLVFPGMDRAERELGVEWA